jgi:tRNA dimethylallyltransferase
MINLGLTQEVEALFPHKSLNALQTVGYKELFDYFENKLSLDEAIDLIKQNTRRFSKRQMTWFKKNKDIKWFDRKSLSKEIVDFIESR